MARLRDKQLLDILCPQASGIRADVRPAISEKQS
jgi:hypothetical protein